jgi:hypothetical protein
MPSVKRIGRLIGRTTRRIGSITGTALSHMNQVSAMASPLLKSHGVDGNTLQYAENAMKAGSGVAKLLEKSGRAVQKAASSK